MGCRLMDSTSALTIAGQAVTRITTERSASMMTTDIRKIRFSVNSSIIIDDSYIGFHESPWVVRRLRGMADLWLGICFDLLVKGVTQWKTKLWGRSHDAFEIDFGRAKKCRKNGTAGTIAKKTAAILQYTCCNLCNTGLLVFVRTKSVTKKTLVGRAWWV